MAYPVQSVMDEYSGPQWLGDETQPTGYRSPDPERQRIRRANLMRAMQYAASASGGASARQGAGASADGGDRGLLLGPQVPEGYLNVDGRLVSQDALSALRSGGGRSLSGLDRGPNSPPPMPYGESPAALTEPMPAASEQIPTARPSYLSRMTTAATAPRVEQVEGMYGAIGLYEIPDDGPPRFLRYLRRPQPPVAPIVYEQ